MVRKDEKEWVKKVTKMTVEGARPAGRPRKTWQETVGEDMRELNIVPDLAIDRRRWRTATRCTRSNPGPNLETRTLNRR